MRQTDNQAKDEATPLRLILAIQQCCVRPFIAYVGATYGQLLHGNQVIKHYSRRRKGDKTRVRARDATVTLTATVTTHYGEVSELTVTVLQKDLC